MRDEKRAQKTPLEQDGNDPGIIEQHAGKIVATGLLFLVLYFGSAVFALTH